VLTNGIVKVRPFDISIGSRWARQRARVDIDDHHFAVFINHQLVRAGTLDTTRRYQPLRRRPPRPLP